MVRKCLLLLALLLPALGLADVSYNNDAQWGSDSAGYCSWETSPLTVDPGLDDSGSDHLLVVGVSTYNNGAGSLNASCRWGGPTGDIMTLAEWEGGSSIQRVWLFYLHAENVTGSNSETVYCTCDAGNQYSTGINFFALTYDGVDGAAPVNACAGTCKDNSGGGAGATLTVGEANLNGDAGDMIVSIGDSFGAPTPTCTSNGQSAAGPTLVNNSNTCAMWKSWGGPQGNDAEFANSDYSSMATMVVNASDLVAGPSTGLLRRGRGR